MSRFFGYTATGTVKSAVESFESTTQVKSAGGVLLGTVYVDIEEEEWAVAIAYGWTQHPKLRGPEPSYEVRYAYRTAEEAQIRCLDTRKEDHSIVAVEPFSSVDEFVLWSLKEESGRISGVAN